MRIYNLAENNASPFSYWEVCPIVLLVARFLSGFYCRNQTSRLRERSLESVVQDGAKSRRTRSGIMDQEWLINGKLGRRRVDEQEMGGGLWMCLMVCALMVMLWHCELILLYFVIINYWLLRPFLFIIISQVNYSYPKWFGQFLDAKVSIVIVCLEDHKVFIKNVLIRHLPKWRSLFYEQSIIIAALSYVITIITWFTRIHNNNHSFSKDELPFALTDIYIQCKYL